MNRILILKDNYNSFEEYYLEKLNELSPDITAMYYYTSNCIFRKLFTHYGFPFEHLWYGSWKRELMNYDIIIVFDSLHSSKLLRYIHKCTDARLIYWHWNPIILKNDINILKETKKICEHWSFNQSDVLKFEIFYNNQFFFYQKEKKKQNSNMIFFVGKDKGRSDKIIEIGKKLEEIGFETDFHIIVNDIHAYEQKKFLQETYMEYSDVVSHIRLSRAVLEIVQDGQTGITARALEALFMNVKLITNNRNIASYSFYNKDNIFILDVDDFNNLDDFLKRPYVNVKASLIYPYSAEGWINRFEEYIE